MGMETINGVPITQEMIQALADEAEQGYDVEQLRKRGRKPLGDGPARVVPVRLDDTLLDAIDARAEQEHVTRSELIRAALREYVAWRSTLPP
ncbi:CopG family transcriptional regulator [Yimella sp. cx-573]|nr:CopG family transcriptional regulator [Yimella sp. cx-573]